jgi:hypothetical protein
MADLTASGTKFTSMQCQPRLMRGQGTTNTRADHSGGSLLRGGHRQLTCQLRAEQIRCEQTDGRTCWPRVYIGRFHAGPMENGFPMPGTRTAPRRGRAPWAATCSAAETLPVELFECGSSGSKVAGTCGPSLPKLELAWAKLLRSARLAG